MFERKNKKGDTTLKNNIKTWRMWSSLTSAFVNLKIKGYMFSVSYARLVVGGVLLLFWGLEGGSVLQDFVLQSTLYPIILALLGHYYIVEVLPLEIKH